MGSTTATITVALFALLAIAVAMLWRHKKAGAGDIKLIGEIAQVESRLDPVGTVIIGGEMWRARSSNGDVISPRTRVRVVGFDDLLALVEVCD
jgi:membrane-bound serine protease (ClpP class)